MLKKYRSKIKGLVGMEVRKAQAFAKEDLLAKEYSTLAQNANQDYNLAQIAANFHLDLASSLIAEFLSVVTPSSTCFPNILM